MAFTITTVSAQETLSRSELLNAAREIISEAGNCALITLDTDGTPRARTMDPFMPEEDFTIWLGTNALSRKVTQIKMHPEVTLYYFDKPSSSYVIIYGRATLVDDKTTKAKYWKQAWADFYPNYPQGYLLIKVIPDSLEVVSEIRGITGNPKTWQAPAVVFTPKN